jgi:RNA polymerase sigma-70 factor, ECF subfamily
MERDGNAQQTITKLLVELRYGNPDAEEQLLKAVYPALKKIARKYLRAERRDHTLQATELINEAYLRLAPHMGEKDWQNRAHFVAVAAQIMRRILVDYARARNATVRGGGHRRIEISERMLVGDDRLEEVLLVDEALTRLSRQDVRQCKAIELRYFGGLTDEEIADVLGVATRTVKRDLNFARAWLHAEISGGKVDDAGT